MRFVDGLQADLKAMILVSQHQNLDAVVAMALVQEEVGAPSPSRAPGHAEWTSSGRSMPRTTLPLPPPPRMDKPMQVE